MATKIETVNFQKHYTGQTHEEITAIVRPLENFGITSFDHFRIYDDNSAVDLTNMPQFCDYYTRNQLYLEGCAGNYNDYHDGYFFWDTLLGASKVFEALAQQCHIAHGVTIVKTYSNYCDHFYLGGALYNPQIKNFFINQKNAIEQFINYYYKAAEHLIAKARLHSYSFPKDRKECDEILNPAFNQDIILPNSNKLHKNTLTKREKDCIIHTLQGKSAKVVAMDLNISPKTVERHLENARKKFGVKNKIALINIIISQNFLYL